MWESSITTVHLENGVGIAYPKKIHDRKLIGENTTPEMWSLMNVLENVKTHKVIQGAHSTLYECTLLLVLQ